MPIFIEIIHYAGKMTMVCPFRQTGALEPLYNRMAYRHHAASRPLWPGGGGVCPRLRPKGCRGRFSTAY